MRDVAKRDLLETYIKYGFQDADDLDFYINEFLGYDIPKISHCPDHVSPFKFLCDVFFEKVNFVFAYGSRTSGKTFIVALLNHLNGSFRQVPIELLVAASVKDQAQKGYGYFKSFYNNRFLGNLIEDSIQSKTVLKNGSILQIVAGTTRGLNGPHAQKVCIDEVELIDLPTLEEGFSIAMSRGSVRGQNILSSTRKYSSGTVTTLLNEKEQRRMSVYSFCVWETLEKCTRECKKDPEYGDCIVWDKCQGRAHECSGWYPIDDFISKIGLLTPSAFSTQWENKTPSGGKVVYGDSFKEDIHVISWLNTGRYKSFHSIFREKEIPKNWRIVGSMDFGSNFGFLMAAIEPRYGIWVVFNEYYFSGDRLLETHAKNIKAHPYWHSRLPIFSDPSGKQGILEMRKHKINCLPAMNDIALGVDEVKRGFAINPVSGLPGILIFNTCTELIRELGVWEHGTTPDGMPDLDSFEDGNDHMLDCLRYMKFTYPRKPRAYVKPMSVAGL